MNLLTSKSLFLGSTALLTVGLSFAEKAQAQEKSRPNVVFILVDDLGWADVKCNHPNSFYETPNLDLLAREGVRFTNAYASCPVCSPTRASLLTGKYPARLNITDWIPGDDPKNRKLIGPQDKHQLPLEEYTWAEALKDQGYVTGFFGKWHIGGEGFYPENQGFDLNVGGGHIGSPHKGGYYSPYQNPKIKDGPEGEYLTDRLTNEAIRFIDENKNKSFLTYLSFYSVHTPIQACKRHLYHFQDKLEDGQTQGSEQRKEHDGYTKLDQDNINYASMVYAMDENVGRVLNKLKELNLYENTLVVFTSDNGGLSTLRRKGYPTSNEPFRAGKGWCYEGGIRVPLIIKSPYPNTVGKVCNESVVSTDFYPTILELTGMKKHSEQHVDGVSLVPCLSGGKQLERKTIYWHYPHYHGSTWTPGAALRHEDWKLVVFYDKEKTELYNLKNDPSEKNDLAPDMPEIVEELAQMLEEWQKSVHAQMPKENSLSNYNNNAHSDW